MQLNFIIWILLILFILGLFILIISIRTISAKYCSDDKTTLIILILVSGSLLLSIFLTFNQIIPGVYRCGVKDGINQSGFNTEVKSVNGINVDTIYVKQDLSVWSYQD